MEKVRKNTAGENMTEFLEEWAPLRKYRKAISQAGVRARPSIRMQCPRCDSLQTFVNKPPPNTSTYFTLAPGLELARYMCAGCNNFERLFFLQLGSDYIRKMGQYPDWEAPLDPSLLGLLGESEAMFRRGLNSEKTGYGIGGFAYYRRVVDDLIGDLLERIPTLLSDAEKPAFAAALEEVRKTTVTQTKIELVKDLLPSRLRPAGINPLDVLYSELSSGLHGKSDEDCLDDAAALRGALAYLVVELARAENAGRQFTADMRKLLEKRGAGKIVPSGQDDIVAEQQNDAQ